MAQELPASEAPLSEASSPLSESSLQLGLKSFRRRFILIRFQTCRPAASRFYGRRNLLLAHSLRLLSASSLLVLRSTQATSAKSAARLRSWRLFVQGPPPSRRCAAEGDRASDDLREGAAAARQAEQAALTRPVAYRRAELHRLPRDTPSQIASAVKCGAAESVVT